MEISLLNMILILNDNHSSYQELPVKFYYSFDAHHVCNAIDENRTNNIAPEDTAEYLASTYEKQ